MSSPWNQIEKYSVAKSVCIERDDNWGDFESFSPSEKYNGGVVEILFLPKIFGRNVNARPFLLFKLENEIVVNRPND